MMTKTANIPHKMNRSPITQVGDPERTVCVLKSLNFRICHEYTDEIRIAFLPPGSRTQLSIPILLPIAPILFRSNLRFRQAPKTRIKRLP